ncbi:hypothetical protein DCS_02664 [Drechmeria coniospora]|uniref:DNA ligase ATP-dependent N-terminal domain-containing protein n=1 Tax=Drechmeria coniospora TaxID=98403 RepID=A0A151GWW3_DRECN|nr:hypothetical protein DCS_02664 [Drechmeria coniospora]KYK61522.1 hypothetical protein DCS_02664 [Drechmeria coniospora]
MPIPFALVCDLLDECHRLRLAQKPNAKVVADWFVNHRSLIDAQDADLAALLSTLLPEKRTDRVYCIRDASLERIVGRALMLGASRLAELARYKQPGLGLDLADCTERILTVTPNPSYSAKHQVSVEELDETLHGLASRIKWSSPAIRSSHASFSSRDRTDLEGVYRRLTIHVIQDAKGKLANSVCPVPLTNSMLASVSPRLGIKVGRQNWFKARSIKHCVSLGHGHMSVEKKLDGEYCQIHVNVTSRPPSIQIFSKSGKDSTEDRQALRGYAGEPST